MPNDPIERAAQSDAPITAAVHQRAVAHEVAEAQGWNVAALSGRTITINRPRAEVFAAWRDLRNLSRFMENVAEVRVDDDQRSHWVIEAPAGRKVEWDAEITEEVEGELLAWESIEGAEVKNTGRVEFREAPPGRGTEVTALIAYEPPGGEVGKLIAKLFQKEPKLQARRDLRRFKQWMETGEVSVAQAENNSAPHGKFL